MFLGLLPMKPKFIYRRAPTIKNRVVRNVVEPPKRPFTFFTGKGFFPWKRCFACSRTKHPKAKIFSFNSTSTGTTFKINDFICCNTEGAVYALECSHSLQYIGHTKRALRVHIKEHVQNILKSFDKHSVSKHFSLVHNKDPSHLKLWGIEPYMRHWHGSHKVRTLSQLESKWIFLMETLTLQGLNTEFDLYC